MPVIVIVVARVVWQEPLTVRKICAIILIITGTIFVSGILSSVRSDVTAAGVAAGFCVPHVLCRMEHVREKRSAGSMPRKWC